jgi:DNA-binding SARP family transcriptional activator/tetratricopeptide (TPR) repeat protein
MLGRHKYCELERAVLSLLAEAGPHTLRNEGGRRWCRLGLEVIGLAPTAPGRLGSCEREGPGMRFLLLGPLVVIGSSGVQVGIGGPRLRVLLAVLLLRANVPVSADELAEIVWDDCPPPGAVSTLRSYVRRLRGALGEDATRVVARGPGFLIEVGEPELDVLEFEGLCREARAALRAGEWAGASAAAVRALRLWRAAPLLDIPAEVLRGEFVPRLDRLRVQVIEDRFDAGLRLGEHEELVSPLLDAAAQYPLQERFHAQLMLALAGTGRRAEALRAYQQARKVLVSELGIEPGPELRGIHRQVLAGDTADMTGRAGDVQPDEVPGTSPGALSGLTGALDTEGPPGPLAEPAGSAPRHQAQLPADIADLTRREAQATYLLSVDPGEDLQRLHGRRLSADAAEASADGVVPGRPNRLGAVAPGPAPRAGAPDGFSRPAQLPADIGDFTGREVHVRQLCEMLTGGSAIGSPGAVPIVFVVGAGGLGKTALAIHAAHKIRDQFPDGQLYVDLLGATSQPTRPGDVLARFLRDLGVEGDKVPAGDEERAAAYRTRLTGRRVLIVLDNARNTGQVRPLLPGSASCAVLVTTRSRAADLAGTRFVDLDVLDDDEALSLFTGILGDADERVLAEPDATVQVLEACAGLPLAIRICAARLAARTRWPIATMARRLLDEHSRLDEMRVGDLAVRASFQVSYDSLQRGDAIDPARMFRLLGIWHGPSIRLPAATALAGAPEEDIDAVEDALEGLVDAHLLESPEPGWYRFHDLLRVYAIERAAVEDSDDDRAAAVERLLGWYLHTADGAAHVVAPHRYQIPLDEAAVGTAVQAGAQRFESGEEAIAWYGSERANIVAATRQAAQAGLHDIAWRLPAGLFPVFNRQDNWADIIATHRVAIDSAMLAGSRPGEGWVRNNLGYALVRIQAPEALGHLEQALAIRRALNDRAGEAQTALALGEMHFKVSGPALALEPFQAALAVAREAGRPSLLTIALNNVGEMYLELGQLEEAADCFQQARDVSVNFGVYGQAFALHNLGRVDVELGRPQEAIASLREALRLHERSADTNGKATARRYLGRAYRAAGDFASARESWTAALAIFRQVGRVAEIAEVEAALSDLP